MNYNNDVISYLQSNKILALKLDHAVGGVREQVKDQLTSIGAGATRLLYYTSCFTDEYQDVCKKQKNEDIRFTKAVAYVLQHGEVVNEMLKIYFEGVLKHKTASQLESIKKMLMKVNIHIAASFLTSAGFSLATATAVSISMNVSMNITAITGQRAGNVVGVLSSYGVVQKAADSANSLHITHPVYYSALYTQGLEMMYFLVEPVFKRAGALDFSCLSDAVIVDTIRKMIG